MDYLNLIVEETFLVDVFSGENNNLAIPFCKENIKATKIKRNPFFINPSYCAGNFCPHK
jgi:hypothetical protein